MPEQRAPGPNADEIHDQLRATMGKMELALDAIGECIVWTDSVGRVEWCNRAFELLVGRPRIFLLGGSLPELISLEQSGAAVPWSSHPASLALGGGGLVNGMYDWRLGQRRFVLDVSASPFELGADATSIVVVMRDITDRQRAEEELIRAKEEASAGSRAKSEFLSRMSHELRTPLNAILGFAQIQELDERDAPRESTRHILKAGSHLLDLINELLDISRIEQGRLNLAPEPVAVADVVEDALELIRPLAKAFGIALRVEPIEPSISVDADRQRMKQALLNLLSNAVKYNRPGGEVGISTRGPVDGRVRILISDTGPGISPERQARLFAPFERLGAELTGVEGTGLGLALTKALVAAMAGSIGVTSAEGSGSTFWFELPVAQMPAVSREPAMGGARSVSAPRKSSFAKRWTVLYVDDNLSSVGLIESALTFRPTIRLLPAMQGRIGLELAREHRPDLVMLDLHLPDMSGAEALARLRADPATQQIPVVILSADASPGQIDRLLGDGARAYLTKPIDLREFLALVDELLPTF